MDVAKYIGLFLLKNNTCYIQGLGNIELRRKPASYDGRNLIPSSMEVVAVPVNTVDDSLSNFIATNEQISISKATNALKEFTAAAKADLQDGKEVKIPAFGNFYEVNGKLQFATASFLQLTPPPIPAERNMPRKTATIVDNRMQTPHAAYYEQPAPAASYGPPPPIAPPPAYDYPQVQAEHEEEKKGGLNWGRVIMFVLILAALIAGIGFVAKNMLKPGGFSIESLKNVFKQEQKNIPLIKPDTLSNQAQQIPVDSTLLIDTGGTMVVTEPPAPQPTTTITGPAATVPPKLNKGPLMNFKVIINTYDERPDAEKRFKRLKSFGNNVELKVEDSSLFYILVPVSVYAADTARVMDSLRRTFNPNGVYIY